MKLLLAVALGVGFLFIFYRAVKLQWPASYFGTADPSAYKISASPIAYLVFRFAPVYVTCLFVSVSLERANGPGFWGGLLVGALYAAGSSGYALVRWARFPRNVRHMRTPIAVLNSVVTVGIVCVALVAAGTRHMLEALVPGISNIATTLWTALVAGVVGAFIVRVSAQAGSSDTTLLERSRRSIPSRLWKLAGELADATGSDRSLVRAVMMVENLQRPRWFRRLERLKGIFVRRGTYGIMQVSGDRPLSDEESVRKAANERFAGVTVTGKSGELDYEALEAFAKSYNADPTFFQLLYQAYESAKARG